MVTEPFRILLVEDNDADRSYFRECLEEINDRPYSFLENPSGRDTLSLCHRFRPHCLILDYNLPQSNGLKVLEELQDEFQRPLYPVVMLTGKGSEKIAVNAMRLGAQDYMVKTDINPESLHRAVHHACDRFQLEKDLRIRTEELESANAQLRDLQSITSALSAGAHLADVARILINQVRISLKADTALVLRQTEAGGLEVLARSGYREKDFSDLENSGAEAMAPVARALNEGQALVFSNHENVRDAFPLVVEVEALRKSVAFVAAPLRLNDKSLAALGLGFSQPRHLTPSELVYLDLMLRQCSEAVARANLYEEEILNKEQLAAAVQTRDEFLSVASHELKTPLTALKLQLQLGRRNIDPVSGHQPDAQRTANHFDSALKQVNRLAGFVDDILDVTKITAGKLILQLETLDINFLLNEAVGILRPSLEKAGVTVVTDFAANVFAHGDRFRMEQAFNNLFANAMKYAPGSELIVSTRAAGSFISISFKDSGPGISPERLPYIFERFERATDSSRISGLGLGLYITREIMEAQGGSITARSRLNEGVTFEISLPRDEAAAITAAG